ncbi:MAG TPA: class I SAM-dependent methyltransferase [Chloroflexota bacterium]|nr:class I SAM-dependent methyltransferase [Chloroflexota bacterium]
MASPDRRRAARVPAQTGLAGLGALLREGQVWTALALQKDVRAFYRLHFLRAALRSGALEALRQPASAAEVIRRVGATRDDLVQAVLELGRALGELDLDGERYRLRGRRARALAHDPTGPSAALLREWLEYHGDVLEWLPDGLRGTDADDYLTRFGDTIAQSSRVFEPLGGAFASAAARAAALGVQQPRLLEIGCGSGVYLRHAARSSPTLTGIGLDLDAGVARAAARNLAAWGLADRFRIAAADVRALRAPRAGRFDLITLYNNVYYFPVGERAALFTALRQWLVPGGKLALVSLFQGHDADAAAFDLVLRATPGCAPLPERDQLRDQLRAGGFARADFTPLALGTPLLGVLASA